MFERLFGNKDQKSEEHGLRDDGRPRLPPGQTLTQKWPVLHYGGVPRIELATWEFKMWGLVESEVSLSWDQFMALPQTTMTTDVHCVTRWSKFENTWTGVHIRDIMALVKPLPEAHHVLEHSYGGYTTNMSLDELIDDDVILAHSHNGQPLTPDHGWPMRLVIPKLYFWKSAKWLRGFEFLKKDQPGFWEQYGYHNHGDPWLEERFG